MKKIFSSAPPREVIRKYLRKKAWNWFDWDQNFFLKPNDSISNLPLLGQAHDEDVVQSLIYLSKYLPDTFLDLGANIGLISMQLANHVEQMICIEPNPLICNILRVNLALNSTNFIVHDYGLGLHNSIGTLLVPRKNLGGAFIRDSNEYSTEQLAKKDGFREYRDTNYLMQSVKIRSCDEALFEIQPEKNKTILVKVDVEGLDQFVLKSLLKTYKDLFLASKIAIVFESHDKQSAQWLKQNVSSYGYEIYGSKISVTPDIRQPLLRRVIKLFYGEEHHLNLIPLDELQVDPSITNFVCCPEKFVANPDFA